MTKIRPSLPKERYGLKRRMFQHRLFHRMIERQEIDLPSVQWSTVENSIYRALDTCAHCPTKAACTAWLTRAEPPLSYVRFCPNSETIETLRIMAT